MNRACKSLEMKGKTKAFDGRLTYSTSTEYDHAVLTANMLVLPCLYKNDRNDRCRYGGAVEG